jgi:alpha-galactosidase
LFLIAFYTATKGLAQEDARLFGGEIGGVQAGGRLRADVKSHAARVFRLRRVKKEDHGFEAKSISRDEGNERDEL